MGCPFCGHENLQGTSQCRSCGHDLTHADLDKEPTGRLHGKLLGTLADLGILDPLVVRPESTVADAVALMRRERHGSVLVVEDDKLVGIFTERDLITRVPIRADLKNITIDSVMTPDPRTYYPDNTVAYALNGMTVKGKRHLPIVDDEDKLVGFVSVRKVLAHIRDEISP